MRPVPPGLGALEVYQNDEWGRKNKEKFMEALVRMDEQLEGKQYLMGERFTVVDITAICPIDFGGFVDLSIPTELKNFTRWYEAVSAGPSASA